MSLAIQGLLAAPSPAGVDAFLRDQTFPLVEGPSVTFVWRGEAEAVNLRHWIYGLASSQASVWKRNIRLPCSDLPLWRDYC